MAHVQIGDRIEFAVLDGDNTDATATAALTTARVTDVNPDEPERCTVQTSMYESLQTIDLRKFICKVVYAVGDVAQLMPHMKGWHIEIANDVQVIEAAVIKRIDADINCALVVFESGRKEWLDLSLSAFKVLVQLPPQSSTVASDNNDAVANQQLLLPSMREQQPGECADEVEQPQQQQQEQHSSEVDALHTSSESLSNNSSADARHNSSTRQPFVPPLVAPALFPNASLTLQAASSSLVATSSSSSSSLQFSAKALPQTDVTSFDWYAEGGHVEFIDATGCFVEGAVLCAKTATHVHLYSETRQFFEVALTQQSFKVVVHGLLSLKSIPVGQSVDVYSPMAGAFVSGTVIKAADVGKLTPIRLAHGAVEWLDLATQTFKLVFFANDASGNVDITAASDGLDATTHSEQPSPLKALEPSSSNELASSPTRAHHHSHHSHHHRSQHRHRSHSNSEPPTLPALTLGQRIEIFDVVSSQFLKYKVAAVDAAADGSLTYMMEPQTNMLNGTVADTITVHNLASVRCRIPLLPHMWSTYRRVLPGHRVDIYDKVEKTVASAKIVQVGDGNNDNADASTASSTANDNAQRIGLLVRYKDGARRWIYAQDVKLKLRLNGESLDAHHANNHHPQQHPRQSPVHTTDNNSAEGLTQANTGATSHDDDAMWERQPRPEASADNSTLHGQLDAPQVKRRLSRHLSEAASLIDAAALSTVALQQSPLALGHSASANDVFDQRSIAIDAVRMTQLIPSAVQPLDFSSLRKIRAVSTAVDSSPPVAASTVIAQTSSLEVTTPAKTARRSSRSAPSSDRGGVPFSLDDVWREARDSERSVVEYIHVASGQRQSHVPEWLERSDTSTGKLFVVHTPTSTLYSMPFESTLDNMSERVSTSRANSSAPGTATSSTGDSGGRVVVPVGPLEAVRVHNMLEK